MELPSKTILEEYNPMKRFGFKSKEVFGNKIYAEISYFKFVKSVNFDV